MREAMHLLPQYVFIAWWLIEQWIRLYSGVLKQGEDLPYPCLICVGWLYATVKFRTSKLHLNLTVSSTINVMLQRRDSVVSQLGVPREKWCFH